MGVKCGNNDCDYIMPDSQVEVNVREILFSKLKNPLKVILKLIDMARGHDKGEDILNEGKYPCPKCNLKEIWKGF